LRARRDTSYLVDDFLLKTEAPEAQQVDVPSFCADEEALPPRLQAERGHGLEPALQVVGLAEDEPLVLRDLDEVDVVGGGDGEEAALSGDEEQVRHLFFLQLQLQFHSGRTVH